MNILYIYNSTHPLKLKTDDTVYTYCLNAGTICALHCMSFNDNQRLNEIALEIRDEYSNFIYALNETFLARDLVLDKKLSLYFISDVSNKRTELFDTYVTICHLLLLKEKMKDIRIDKIIVFGCTRFFVESLQSIFTDIKIDCKNPQSSIKYNFLRNYIIAAYFFIDTFIKRLLLMFFRYHNIQSGSMKSLFFTIFSLHLNENGYELKYGSLVNDTDGYLVSIMMDGMHQWRTLRQYQKDIRILKKLQTIRKIILLDRELTFRDIVIGYFNLISLQRKRKRIKNRTFIFKNINITKFMQYELDISFKRIQRLIIYRNAFRRIFNTLDIENFYYYLHEYSFGRFLSFMLANYFPEIKRIGFQHGPASWRKLLYALAENECSHDCVYLHHVPIPHMVLCEDNLSKEIYENAGYHNIEVMHDVPRLHYLKKIKRNNIRKNTVLIACGLHDGPLMFAGLKEEVMTNKDKRYIIKFHPKTNHKNIIREIQSLPLKNVDIGYEHVSHYLSYVDEVISSYSSVGYEAYCLGINTRVLKLNNRINESPLLDLMLKNKQ